MVLQFEREVEVMEKMYWFSTKNHAHDVEFRFARLQNEKMAEKIFNQAW